MWNAVQWWDTVTLWHCYFAFTHGALLHLHAVLFCIFPRLDYCKESYWYDCGPWGNWSMNLKFWIHTILSYYPCTFSKKTLPKAQQTQGIENFDPFTPCNSKKMLQQALKAWSNFSLVLFGQVQEIHRTYVETLTNSCNNFETSMYQFWQIHITTLRNPCVNFDTSA